MAKLIKIKKTCREHLISRIRERIELYFEYSQYGEEYGMVFGSMHNLRVEWFLPMDYKTYKFVRENVKSHPDLAIMAIRYAD